MKVTLYILLSCFAVPCNAQQSELYQLSKDGSRYELTEAGAEHLASLPLKCILQEFPNKTSHTSNALSDHVLRPQELHPAFFGCFDWHSSVHGHWMLVRLLKEFPNMPAAPKIKQLLQTTLTKANILQEVAYFDLPLTNSWERTYGWAWMLKLAQELHTWKDPEAVTLASNLQPLTQKIKTIWTTFLPKQTYPNRTGVHPNTAFGLTLAYDFAAQTGDTTFLNAIVAAGKTLFLFDTNAPVKWEPNGSDFLSPSLEEADLMRRILSKRQFQAWLTTFLSTADLLHLSKIPTVSDRTDLQIVHLDGLCFTRAWCMRNVAKTLAAKDPRKKVLMKANLRLLEAALPHVVSGSYGGEHWLASFATYSLLE